MIQLALFYTDQRAEALSHGRSIIAKSGDSMAVASLLARAVNAGREKRAGGYRQALFEVPLTAPSTNPRLAHLPF